VREDKEEKKETDLESDKGGFMGLMMYVDWHSVYCVVEGIEPVRVVYGTETVRVWEEEGESKMVVRRKDHGWSERETGDGDIAGGGESAVYGVVGTESEWVVVPKSEGGEDESRCGVSEVVVDSESKEQRWMGYIREQDTFYSPGRMDTTGCTSERVVCLMKN
jgi:hypothetical protein